MLAVLFLTFLDTTIVSVTLGNIQYDLGAGVIPLQWVVNAYSLVFASLMLIAGTLSDRFGRRTLMVAGIAVFCAGSLLCALAPGVGWVIAGRAVMGVGAAASEPGTLSVIRQLYPDRRERARALGAWAAVSGLVAGARAGARRRAGQRRLVARRCSGSTSRSGLVLLVATARLVPNSSDPQPGRLDVGGFVLGAVALGALIFAGISGEQYGYGTGWIVALFVVSAVAFVAFFVVELRVPVPDARPELPARSGRGLRVVRRVRRVLRGVLDLLPDRAVPRRHRRLLRRADGRPVRADGGRDRARLDRVGTVGRARRPEVADDHRLRAERGRASSIARFLLVASPPFAGLSVVLAVAGLGFGIAVVPLTSAVLGHVPARAFGHGGVDDEHRSAARLGGRGGGTRRHRERLPHRTTSPAALQARGTGQDVIDYILGLIETGGSDARNIDLAHPPEIIKELVDAAAAAFRTGMHVALLVSAALILVAALATALVPGRRMAPSAEVD